MREIVSLNLPVAQCSIFFPPPLAQESMKLHHVSLLKFGFCIVNQRLQMLLRLHWHDSVVCITLQENKVSVSISMPLHHYSRVKILLL